MSTISVSNIETANGATDLTLRTGNTSAGDIIIKSDGVSGIVLSGNSTTNTAILYPNGHVVIANSTVNTFTLTSTGVLTVANKLNVSGDVGIGTDSPTYKVTVGGYGQETAALTDSGNKGGSVYLRADAVGVGSGGAVLFGTTFGNGTPFAAIKSLVVDGAGNTRGDLAFSTRNATSDTALAERMRIDSAGLITQLNATSGAGAIVGEQTFRLAANGSAANQGVVTDFFGATSIISLEASSVYQITAYCVFTKTTAGTVAWNMFASSAPTRMVGTYLGSPVTGIGAGAPISGFTGAQGATTATFAATGSLTTAVNHAFQFTIQVQTNAATGFRLQINSVTGSATPLAGSYYTVKKISASTGTFV